METVKYGLEIGAAFLGIVFVLFVAWWTLLGKEKKGKGL